MTQSKVKWAGPLLAVALCLPAPAWAGEEPLYAAPQPWIEVTPLDGAKAKAGPPLVLLDIQERMEGGKLLTYRDIAYRVDSPEALTTAGTLTASWIPDKGDIVIHKVEILRGDEMIDVVGGGKRFEVLRREQQLEQRLIDGMLTVTMAVPGLRVGDIVRMSYTTEQGDQALGDEVQTVEMLLSKPMPIQAGKVRVSWPAGQAMNWRIVNAEGAATPVTQGGYTSLSVDLPLPERDDMPADAPARYRMPPMLQAASFDSWEEVSSLMARHFATEGTIAGDGDLMKEVKAIAAQTPDQLTRASLALRLVQDKVSYLLNGLDGGNYLPQSPELTWRERYGDCKAKSLLLLAMLRELGIESEALLVRSSGGDILPGLLPMPADFDHVIVRAVIGDTEYWLDGTSAGSRLATIGDVPEFSWGLPLRPAGSGLIPLTPRPKARPDRVASFTIDQSAGVDLPAVFFSHIELSGAMGASLRQIGQLNNDDYLKLFVATLIQTMVGNSELATYSFTYDDEAGLAKVDATGLLDTLWKFERGRASQDVPGLPASHYNFAPDRAKLAWRDIPAVNPSSDDFETRLEIVLPDGGKGFELRGREEVDSTIGGVKITRSARIEEGRLFVTERAASFAGEIAPADIAAEKAKAARFAAGTLKVRAPVELTRRWDYATPGARRKLASTEAVYDALIARKPDEAAPYTSRAFFRASILDRSGALGDLDKAIELEPSVQRYFMRANLLVQLGRNEDALADVRSAFALDPTPQNAMAEALQLAELGAFDEAMEIVETYEDEAGDQSNVMVAKSQILAMSGKPEEGLAVLEQLIAERPGDPGLLNDVCWHMGTWQVGSGEMLARCTQAVESASWSPPVLDSRAMAYFRLGRLQEALADLDAALAAQPDLAPTMFMRGIVKANLGNARDGQADIETALRIAPSIAKQYARYGIVPPKP